VTDFLLLKFVIVTKTHFYMKATSAIKQCALGIH